MYIKRHFCIEPMTILVSPTCLPTFYNKIRPIVRISGRSSHTRFANAVALYPLGSKLKSRAATINIYVFSSLSTVMSILGHQKFLRIFIALTQCETPFVRARCSRYHNERMRTVLYKKTLAKISCLV